MFIPSLNLRRVFEGTVALNVMALGALSQVSAGSLALAAFACLMATLLRRKYRHALLLGIVAGNAAVVLLRFEALTALTAPLTTGLISALLPELLLTDGTLARRARLFAWLYTLVPLVVGSLLAPWVPPWVWLGGCAGCAFVEFAFWQRCERKFITAPRPKLSAPYTRQDAWLALFLGLVGVCLGLLHAACTPFSVVFGLALAIRGPIRGPRLGPVLSLTAVLVGLGLSSWFGSAFGGLAFGLAVAGAIGFLDSMHQEIASKHRPPACDASLLNSGLVGGIAAGVALPYPSAAVPLSAALLLFRVVADHRRTASLRARLGAFRWEEFRRPGARVQLCP